jgi:hypothetical protein
MLAEVQRSFTDADQGVLEGCMKVYYLSEREWMNIIKMISSSEDEDNSVVNARGKHFARMDRIGDAF